MTHKNSYQKFITKCDRGILQSAPGITKYDRLVVQNTSGITKCDSYYKLRRNTGGFELRISSIRSSYLTHYATRHEHDIIAV